jgi:hypothetical protein
VRRGRLSRDITAFGCLSRIADLVFKLFVAPDADDIRSVAGDLRGALHVLDVGDRVHRRPVALPGMGDEMDMNRFRYRPGDEFEDRFFLPLVILAADAQPHQAVDHERVAAVAASRVFEDLYDSADSGFADQAEHPDPAVQPIDDFADVGFWRPVNIAGLHGQAPGYRLPWRKTADRLLFRPGEVTLWTGATGMGKSQVLSNALVAMGETFPCSCG